MSRSFLLVLLLTATMSAQAPITLPVCEGFNDAPGSTATPFPVGDNDRIGVLYSPSVDVQVGGVSFFFSQVGSPTNPLGVLGLLNATIELRDADPSTLRPVPTVRQSGAFLGAVFPSNVSDVYLEGSFNGTEILTAGSFYWFILDVNGASAGLPIVPGPLGISLGVDPAPTDAIVSVVDTGMGFGPLDTTNAFKFRVVSPDCNIPGRGPSWTNVGTACSIGANAPSLVGGALPAIGSNADLRIAGGVPGAPYGLFLAASVDPAGISIGAGCAIYLDLSSFATFFAAGLNPVLTGALDATGSASFVLPIPNDLGAIGASLAFQAAVVGPNAIGVLTTEAQVATIGF